MIKNIKLYKVYPINQRYGGYLTIAAETEIKAKSFVEHYIKNTFANTLTDEWYAFTNNNSDGISINVLIDNIKEITYASYKGNYSFEEIEGVFCDSCIFDSWDY